MSNYPLTSSIARPYSISGNFLNILESQKIFSIANEKFHHDFVYCKLPMAADGLVDYGFLRQRGGCSDYETETLHLDVQTIDLSNPSNTVEGFLQRTREPLTVALRRMPRQQS